MSEPVEYFRTQAEFLLRDLKADHPNRVQGALARIRRALPKTRTMSTETIRSTIRHSNALEVIAHEQHYASWAELVKAQTKSQEKEQEAVSGMRYRVRVTETNPEAAEVRVADALGVDWSELKFETVEAALFDPSYEREYLVSFRVREDGDPEGVLNRLEQNLGVDRDEVEITPIAVDDSMESRVNDKTRQLGEALLRLTGEEPSAGRATLPDGLGGQALEPLTLDLLVRETRVRVMTGEHNKDAAWNVVMEFTTDGPVDEIYRLAREANPGMSEREIVHHYADGNDLSDAAILQNAIVDYVAAHAKQFGAIPAHKIEEGDWIATLKGAAEVVDVERDKDGEVTIHLANGSKIVTTQTVRRVPPPKKV